MSDMDLNGGARMELLLLRFGEFGALVSQALQEAAGEEFQVQNLSVLLLCRLDLEGPMRPNQIAELENLTTGGVSKLIDRMEADGLVERRRGVLATDRRSVLVVITRKGRDLARRMASALETRLTETEAFLGEIRRLLAD
jgi:DNA-binding MarR family transcriptional regulator